MFCYPMVVLDQNYGGGPKIEWRMERVLKACQERHAGNFANLRGRGRNERRSTQIRAWQMLTRDSTRTQSVQQEQKDKLLPSAQP